MKVEYEITPEDWAAFGEYHARTSSHFRKFVHVGIAVGVVLLLAIGEILSLSTDSPVFVVVGLVAAIIWVLYWPRQVIANVRTHMARKDQPCLRGRHLMEVLPEGLHAKCDVTDSVIGWAGIRDVIRTADHVFVMLSDEQGYVVPKKRVITGDLEPLIDEVEHLRRRSSV